MGKRLREIREAKFITQAELSEMTGIAEATISRIEHGLQSPRISTIRKLAKALEVEPAALAERPDSCENNKAAT
jgi:transcriptional regulator with XRE-family HTH domain